jgi:hypothetical protein
MVLLVTLLIMGVVWGLIIYRKHELQRRWNEFRRHQLFAAQDEAFDWTCLATEEDDDIYSYDLDLESSINMT